MERKGKDWIRWPRLFCTALFRARPGQLLVLRISKEGSHENRPAKVALVFGGMVRNGQNTFLWGVFWRYRGPIGMD